MIDRDTAKSLVERHLSTLPPKDGSHWVVLEHKTLEFDVGWVFFWTLERLTRPGYKGTGMAGNSPIVVDKRDGSLYVWGMLEPIDRVLEKLRHDKASLPRLDTESG